MFNSRGGFSGQRPMGMHRMNQPGMNQTGMSQPGMNLPRMGMSSMNMSGMGMSSMGMSSMNQTNLNLSSMSTPVMNSGMSQPHMGLSGMNSSLGLNSMNQSGVNVYRMGPPGMNQGGMGFQSEMKSQGFGMRPMDSPGSFLGNSDPMGMKNMPLRSPMHTSPERLMGPQSMPRFPSPSGPVPSGQPRMHPQNQEMPPLINRGLTHPSDHLRGNLKPPLQEPPHHMKEKPLGALGVFGRLSQEMGMKSGPSSMDPMPGPKNRYTNESASSILSSFGLSNEDLEELSRYPDEQLTPGNLPNILRDIRLRKINRPGPSHDQGGGGRRPGEVVPSKVIDYGHSSKFPYSDNSVSSRPFESSRADRKSSPISKEPAPPSANTEQDRDISMLNKIPTLCGRKASLPASKQDRSNNKTLVGEPSKMPSDGSVNVPNTESAMITIQPDSTPLCDIPVILDTDLTTETPMASLVDQGNYPPPVEAAPPGKANWSSPLSQEEMQNMKKLPTPSMMNDYFAASPRIFPHICSLCNVECRHIKDWVKHQNNSSHIENCRKLRQQYPDWNPQVHTLRDDGKEGTSPKRSRSKSGSPRRSRRSGSRHRTRRSNSPRSGKRSRSRSPRRARRSPMRSRSPRRNTRSPQRSLSPRKQRRARSASTPDKRAVDAAVQRFIDSNKVQSGEKERPAKPPSNGKTLPAKSTNSSSVKGRKPSETTSSSTRKASSSSSTSSAKKPSSTTSPSRSVKKPSSSTSPNRSVKKPSSTSPNRSVKKPSSTTSPSRSMKKPSSTTSPSRSMKKPSSTSSPSRSVRKPSSTSSPSSSSRKPPTTTSSSSSSVKKPASNSSNSSSNNAPRKPLPPKHGPGSSAPKKPVVSTGAKKTTPATTAGKKPPPRKQPATQNAPSTQKPPEPFTALNKFLFAKGGSDKVIHVTNLPDSGYTDQDILKIVQPFGKVCDILIVRSKNEAFLETNFREAATAAVKFSETVPVVINHKRLTLSLVGQNKEQAKTEVESANDNSASEKPLPETVNEENQLKEEEKKEEKVEKEEPKEEKEEKRTEKTGKVKPDLGIPPGFVKRYRLIDPPLTDLEKCVVVISNLPEKQYTEEEISNLAKPFGGANDTLIISTHRKAYLELSNRNSVDSMMKFYSVFPTFLGGNSLNIAMSSRYKDVKDENRIFADILEQAPYKITPSVYEKFVHLSNLPEKEIDEFEIARFGLRFGKVEHYMIISNKKKAILHMNTASAAKTMKNFLTRYPVNIDENILSCSLASKKSMAEDEYESYLEEEKSSEPETNMFEGEVAPTPDEVKKGDPRDSLPTSPVSEMDTDETANPGEACEEEDEEEEEEEAAEAPEAPEGSSVFVHPQPVEQQQEYNKVPQSYTSEEMDVLVSVESDEEEYDTQDSQNQHDMASLLTAEESEEHDSELETSKESRSKPAGTQSSQGKEPHRRGGSTSEKERKSESEGNEEESAAQVPENVTKVSGSTDKKGTSNKSEDRRERDTKHSYHSSSRYGRSGDDKYRSYEDRSRSRNERSRHSGGSKEHDHTAADATRTAKYNPQKGEICVTLNVDGQKSSRTPDPRKRSAGEGASSGRESSTPKSSSNRSSPSENHKTSSGAHQSKSSHRSTSSQDKDSKVASRARENDNRSSGRKDDRSKDSSSSSSSRHARSTRTSTRGQRSKEDEKEIFPFNLDEFVTVDEIVEDRGTSQKTKAGAADAAKSGKSKETATPTSDSKKAKQGSTTTAQDLSFVTLDEVGDEEDAATAAETSQGKDAQSLVIADAEDAPTASAKDSEMLMTLDEVSDDEDAQAAAAAELHSSTAPDILTKDQLLTLDEVCAEDEEQASPSEPRSSKSKLPQDTANKQGSSIALKAKENQKALDNSVSELGQDSQADQSLLTLDEVKGEDEDAELQFLTVDEIGEEEEAAEQAENDGKSQPGKRVTKSQPAGKRVGVKKRPLPEDSKDASQQSPADSTAGNQPEKTPAKAGDAASKDQETPAKKSKLESPAKEHLGPFNSSVAVGMEYLVPKTGFFCELCSLFYMDDASKLKHCKSLRHYQAVQKQLTEEESAEAKTPST